MNLPTIVDAYLLAAIRHVEIEPLGPNSSWFGIPELASGGILASDFREALPEIFELIEDAVARARENGRPLPVFEGIDLNTDDAGVLSGYHASERRRDPDQAWFWTPQWQQMECEVDDDIKRGRVNRSHSGEDFLTHIAKP